MDGCARRKRRSDEARRARAAGDRGKQGNNDVHHKSGKGKMRDQLTWAQTLANATAVCKEDTRLREL
jgi:hypothetical protein